MSPTEVEISRLPWCDSCKGCLGCPGYDASKDELDESFNITQFFASNAGLLEYCSIKHAEYPVDKLVRLESIPISRRQCHLMPCARVEAYPVCV